MYYPFSHYTNVLEYNKLFINTYACLIVCVAKEKKELYKAGTNLKSKYVCIAMCSLVMIRLLHDAIINLNNGNRLTVVLKHQHVYIFIYTY